MTTTNEALPAPNGTAEFIRVSEAKKRYFGGTMSLRWWYRQVETGRLPHRRAGNAVRLEVAAVEAFVAATHRDAPTPAPEQQQAVAPARSRVSRAARGGLRFFPEDA
jgi:hypothetical protein